MNLPSLIFGFVSSSLFAAIFHLVAGGSIWKLILLLFSAWISFFSGNWIAETLGIDLDKIGELHIGFASVLCFATLALVNWLLRESPPPKNRS